MQEGRLPRRRRGLACQRRGRRQGRRYRQCKRGDSGGEVLHIAHKHHTHTDGRADTNTKIYVLRNNGTRRWYNPPDLSRKKIHSSVSCAAGDAATLN